MTRGVLQCGWLLALPFVGWWLARPPPGGAAAAAAGCGAGVIVAAIVVATVVHLPYAFARAGLPPPAAAVVPEELPATHRCLAGAA